MQAYPTIEGIEFRSVADLPRYANFKNYAVSSDGKVWYHDRKSWHKVDIHPDDKGRASIWMYFPEGGGSRIYMDDLMKDVFH